MGQPGKPSLRAKATYRCSQKWYCNLGVTDHAGSQAEKARGVRIPTLRWDERQHLEDPRGAAHWVRQRKDHHQLRALVSNPELHGRVDNQFAHALLRARPIAPVRNLCEQADGCRDVAVLRSLPGGYHHAAKAGGITGYGLVKHRSNERHAIALSGAHLQTLGFFDQLLNELSTT